MKIAFLTQHYAPHFEGGTERVVRAHAAELAARGHDLRIVAGTDRPHAGIDVECSNVDGLPVAHLPRKPDEPYDLVLDRPRIRALLEAETAGCDIIHLHHWSTLCSDAVRTLAKRTPVVVTFHCLFATCPRFFRIPPRSDVHCPERGDFEPCIRCIAEADPGRTEDAWRVGLAARAGAFEAEARAAALLLAPSRSHADRVAPLLGRRSEELEVQPNGLCARIPSPEPATRAPWRGDRALNVLHFGHRSTVKGTMDLVRALAPLAAEGPGVELRLAGEEVERGFDDALRAAAGALPLRFEGAYDAADLPRIAAGADLAAFPSRAWESYGLVVDEALALGLPTWVSDRGALAERVGSAGRALPAAEPAAWTSAFRSVLARPSELELERRAIPSNLYTAREAAADLEARYVRSIEVRR